MVNLNTKMAIKVTKGLICSGTISKYKSLKDYYICGKFHTDLYQKVHTTCTMPLYYYVTTSIYIISASDK